MALDHRFYSRLSHRQLQILHTLKKKKIKRTLTVITKGCNNKESLRSNLAFSQF